MPDQEYTPPKVWVPKPAEGRFASINRPVAGPTHEKELPVGKHPMQLYSLATPNGVKVTVMLEELLALGVVAGALGLGIASGIRARSVADDLVDEAAAGDTPLAALQARLDAIYASTPHDHVEDHALSLVVQQYKLPRHLLDALIEGFAWDASGRTYDSIEDVHAYGARVAGSVGAMMSWIMGPQSMDTLARACELGVAMQLSNIARVEEAVKAGKFKTYASRPVACIRYEVGSALCLATIERRRPDQADAIKALRMFTGAVSTEDLQRANALALEILHADDAAARDIASGSPAVTQPGTPHERTCPLCLAHINHARDALGFKRWPEIPATERDK